SGLRTSPEKAVALALAATRAFVEERAAQGRTAWRLAELADGPARVAARLQGQNGHSGPSVEVPVPPVGGPVGVVPQDDGRFAMVAVVPLGRMSVGPAELIARLAPTDLQLTPWRSVVVPDLADDDVDEA